MTRGYLSLVLHAPRAEHRVVVERGRQALAHQHAPADAEDRAFARQLGAAHADRAEPGRAREPRVQHALMVSPGVLVERAQLGHERARIRHVQAPEHAGAEARRRVSGLGIDRSPARAASV